MSKKNSVMASAQNASTMNNNDSIVKVNGKNILLHKGEFLAWTFGKNGEPYFTKKEALESRMANFGYLYASVTEMDRLIPVNRYVFAGSTPVCEVDARTVSVVDNTLKNSENDAICVHGRVMKKVAPIIKNNLSISIGAVKPCTSEGFIVKLRLKFKDTNKTVNLLCPFYNHFQDSSGNTPTEILMGFAESLIDLAPQHYEDYEVLEEFADAFFDKFLVNSQGIIIEIWTDEDEKEKRRYREMMIECFVTDLSRDRFGEMEVLERGYCDDYEKFVTRVCNRTCVKKSEYRDFIIEKFKEYFEKQLEIKRD